MKFAKMNHDEKKIDISFKFRGDFTENDLKIADNTYEEICDLFSEKSTITWTAGSAGTREIYVDVKDAAGNRVKSSALTIKVK